MYINKDDYLGHINDEEQVLNMKRILDKLEMSLNNHTVETTDFLNPYEVKLAESILNRFMDLGYRVYGGSEQSERKLISIYPEYYYFTDEDLELKALEIKNFTPKLSHRDFLGAILALGIVRDKVGDIIIHEDRAYVLLKREIFDYVLYNLEKIGRENIEVRPVNLGEVLPMKEDYSEKSSTVSSLRIDSIIGLAYNLSRNDSQRLVKNSRVKINWKPIEKNSIELNSGDLISVKGFGRFILHSIDGITRKDRIRVTVRLIK